MAQKVVVKVQLELDDEFLSNVLVTAFDGSVGGCWYWARPDTSENNSWLGVDGDIWQSVRIMEQTASGEGAPRKFFINHLVVAMAIVRLFENNYKIDPNLLRHLHDAIMAQDAGQIDSGDADVIMQIACFDTVVYG